MVMSRTARYNLRICCWLFCVFTVLGSAGVVAWLSLTPENPNLRISLVNFSVQDSKNESSHRNTSITVPDRTMIFDLRVLNPNKRMGVYYGVFNLELYSADGGVVGTSSTPGFYQGYENSTTLQIVINADREFWGGFTGGVVDFMVRVKTDVKFRIIRWTTKSHRVVYEERFRNVKIKI